MSECRVEFYIKASGFSKVCDNVYTEPGMVCIRWHSLVRFPAAAWKRLFCGLRLRWFDS